MVAKRPRRSIVLSMAKGQFAIKNGPQNTSSVAAKGLKPEYSLLLSKVARESYTQFYLIPRNLALGRPEWRPIDQFLRQSDSDSSRIFRISGSRLGNEI